MAAKRVLFIGSAAVAVVGVAVLATLGAVAKVPPTEYWTVVLGSAAFGVGWMLLLATLHHRAANEAG